MKIEVRYFAAAREASGLEAESLDVPEGTTVATLDVLLVDRHPSLASLSGNLRFAVGERFATRDTSLAEDDVVALLPPVSGG